MNKRLKELYLQSHTTRHYDGDPALEGNPPTVYWQGEVSAQRFAELIVKECVEQIYPQWIKDHSHVDPANLADAVMRVKEHFGVEEQRGWVCPKCGTDRTKAVCPKGNTAAVTDDCPMYGVAQ